LVDGLKSRNAKESVNAERPWEQQPICKKGAGSSKTKKKYKDKSRGAWAKRHEFLEPSKESRRCYEGEHE